MSKKEVKENINQKMERLEREVEWFYSEDFKLEEATEKYRGALELSKEIEDDLEKMKNEITVIDRDFSR